MKKIVSCLIILVSLFCVYAANDTSGVRDVQSFEIQGIIPVINPSNNKQVYLYVRDMYDDSNRPVVQGDIINLGYAQKLQDDFVHMFRVELLTNSFTTPKLTIAVEPFTKADDNLIEYENTTLSTQVRSVPSYSLPDGLSVDNLFVEFKAPNNGDRVDSYNQTWKGQGKKILWNNSGRTPSDTNEGVTAKSEDIFQAKYQEYIDNGEWHHDSSWSDWYYYYYEIKDSGWKDITDDPEVIGNNLISYYIDYYIKINPSSVAYEETKYKMDVTVTLDGE